MTIVAAPAGMTNVMPDDTKLQKAYARLDKSMLYFLWQNAFTQPTASKYVSNLLQEEPSLVNKLEGKLAIVTGVTIGGAGYHVAEELAIKLGMDVILLGRSSDKLKAAIDSIKSKDCNSKLYQVSFDLDDLESAVSASKEIKSIANTSYNDAVHILVNNAGANIPTRGFTKQGIEVNTGRNYMSPHQLTRELMPLLQKASSGDNDFIPRVVFVASIGHISGIDFDAERFAKYPDEGGAPESYFKTCGDGVSPKDKVYRDGDFMGGAGMYMYAKYAMVATTYAWSKHEGPTVAFYSLQPGSIYSNFGSNAHWLLNFLYYRCFYMFQFSPSQGAVSTLRACLDPTLVSAHPNGAYLHADGQPCMPRAPKNGKTIQELGEEIYKAANAICDKLLGVSK